MNTTGSFYALLFRMSYIHRWGLMDCAKKETLLEHSMQVSILTHALTIIGVARLEKTYSPERLAAAALYHDMSEIYTGDLPTPVKYYNSSITEAYKTLERKAEDKLLSMQDEKTRTYYQELLALNEEEKRILKSADKLAAYLKCKKERSYNNRDFAAAEEATKKALENTMCEELHIFMEEYFPAFLQNLDEIVL
mgnify:FL=1